MTTKRDKSVLHWINLVVQWYATTFQGNQTNLCKKKCKKCVGKPRYYLNSEREEIIGEEHNGPTRVRYHPTTTQEISLK